MMDNLARKPEHLYEKLNNQLPIEKFIQAGLLPMEICDRANVGAECDNIKQLNDQKVIQLHEYSQKKLFRQGLHDLQGIIKENQAELPENEQVEAKVIAFEEAKKLLKKRKETADRIDNLTELFNRHQFIYSLSDLLNLYCENPKRIEQKKIVVAGIDLDYFKTFNDGVSHEFGNLALRTVSLAIVEYIKDKGRNPFCVKPEEVGEQLSLTAREGGEEFLMAIEFNKDEDPTEFIQGLQKKVKESVSEIIDQTDNPAPGAPSIRERMMEVMVNSRSEELDAELLNAYSQEGQESTKDKYLRLCNELTDKSSQNLILNGFDIWQNFSQKTPNTQYKEIKIIRREIANLVGNDQEKQVAIETLDNWKNNIIDLIPFGGATVGFVEFQGDMFDQEIDNEGLEKIQSQVNSEAPFVKEAEFIRVMDEYLTDGKIRKGTTYREIKEKIDAEIAHLTKDDDKYISWNRFLQVAFNFWAGEIKDHAVEVQEETKKTKRGITNGKEFVPLEERIDEIELGVGEREVLRKTYQHEKKRLLELAQEDSNIHFDIQFKQSEKYAEKYNELLGGGEENEWIKELAENEEIIEDQEKSQKIRYLDHLTASYNEDKLMDYNNFEMREARKCGADYSMAILDMDNLKAVNDGADHFIGDVALMIFARVVREKIAAENKKYEDNSQKYNKLVEAERKWKKEYFEEEYRKENLIEKIYNTERQRCFNRNGLQEKQYISITKKINKKYKEAKSTDDEPSKADIIHEVLSEEGISFETYQNLSNDLTEAKRKRAERKDDLNRKIEEKKANQEYERIIKKFKDAKKEVFPREINFFRITGGEEFGLTFSGMNAEEAGEILNMIKGVAHKEIIKFLKNIKVIDKVKQWIHDNDEDRDPQFIGTSTSAIVNANDINIDQMQRPDRFNIGWLKHICFSEVERKKGRNERGENTNVTQNIIDHPEDYIQLDYDGGGGQEYAEAI